VTELADRLAYALAHPLNTARGIDMARYQQADRQRDGNLLLTILAVDR
jgi:hypothetical protein